MFASTDGGQTFRELPYDETWGIGGDCEVALGPHGWSFLHSTVAGATITTTGDEGTTWTVSNLAAIPINGLADRPWLAAVGDELWLSYMPLYAEPGAIGFTKSTDGGATWAVPKLIALPSAEGQNVFQGHFAVSADNATVRIPILSYTGVGLVGGSEMDVRSFFAVTRDGGNTWTEEEVPLGGPCALWWPAADSSQDGTLHWAFVRGNELFVVMSTDDGATWSAPMSVLANLGYADILWLDGSIGNNATIVFTANAAAFEGGDGTSLYAVRLQANATPEIVQAVESQGSQEFITVAHDGLGRATIVYTTGQGQYAVQENGTW
jgi:hypothetical protein